MCVQEAKSGITKEGTFWHGKDHGWDLESTSIESWSPSLLSIFQMTFLLFHVLTAMFQV
jgi:hypothetical protein